MTKIFLRSSKVSSSLTNGENDAYALRFVQMRARQSFCFHSFFLKLTSSEATEHNCRMLIAASNNAISFEEASTSILSSLLFHSSPEEILKSMNERFEVLLSIRMHRTLFFGELVFGAAEQRGADCGEWLEGDWTAVPLSKDFVSQMSLAAPQPVFFRAFFSNRAATSFESISIRKISKIFRKTLGTSVFSKKPQDFSSLTFPFSDFLAEQEKFGIFLPSTDFERLSILCDEAGLLPWHKWDAIPLALLRLRGKGKTIEGRKLGEKAWASHERLALFRASTLTENQRDRRI